MSDKLTATSSGNGYCKMPDGTLIQWGTVRSGVLTWTAFGNWYETNTVDLGSFPISFISTPIVTFNSLDYRNFAISGNADVSATNIGNVRFYRPSAPGSVDATIGWIAIGRWK